mmetsp:Transcript_110179/g.310716  ORF Transcript_110179/g.310716 Transcript_110179/m.310716 type:complete len:235 (-) Transcript_110179:1061-1765(-)
MTRVRVFMAPASGMPRLDRWCRCLHTPWSGGARRTCLPRFAVGIGRPFRIALCGGGCGGLGRRRGGATTRGRSTFGTWGCVGSLNLRGASRRLHATPPRRRGAALPLGRRRLRHWFRVRNLVIGTGALARRGAAPLSGGFGPGAAASSGGSLRGDAVRSSLLECFEGHNLSTTRASIGGCKRLLLLHGGVGTDPAADAPVLGGQTRTAALRGRRSVAAHEVFERQWSRLTTWRL